jgi:thiamine transport system permease protein
LTFPFLFRWQLTDQLRFLKNQTEIAKVLGAGRAQIYFQITWPQIQSKVILASSLAALWSLGDFAVSTFFISGDQTLGLMVIDLIGRYRLEQASFLSLMILILGLLIFQLLQRVFRYVGH